MRKRMTNLNFSHIIGPFSLAMDQSPELPRASLTESASFAVAILFVLFQECPRRHFLGAFAVPARLFCALLAMFILPVLFGAHSAQVLFPGHYFLPSRFNLMGAFGFEFSEVIYQQYPFGGRCPAAIPAVQHTGQDHLRGSQTERESG